MDRYICKAKCKNTGKWVYGYPACLDYMTNEIFLVAPEFITHRIDQKTICQCIGWNDSYKTPIFEKDIVEFNGAGSNRYLIWWCNEMNMMSAVPLDGIEFNGWDYWNSKYNKFNYSDFCLMMQDPWGDFKDIKVIGNIIDNPELINSDKEKIESNYATRIAKQENSEIENAICTLNRIRPIEIDEKILDKSNSISCTSFRLIPEETNA